LQSVLLVESVLNRIELAVLLQALDGHDLASVGLNRERGTRLHRLAVQQDSAGSAGRGVTADVRAGERKDLADEVDEKHARLDLAFANGSVDVDSNLVAGHCQCSPFARA